MLQISELTSYLESIFSPAVQENYDNSGMQTGNSFRQVSSALVCLDVTEEVLQEAIEKNCQLIISHHPMIFGGLKKLTSGNKTERLVEFAIKNDLAVYALHTNADNTFPGLNSYLASKLNLSEVKILSPREGGLRKLVTFCPVEQAEQVREAMFKAGAGFIGEYDSCSFNTEGFGTFRGSDKTNPFAGEQGKLHTEKEIRIETIFPDYLQSKVLSALFGNHPYEEVAFDIYRLENENPLTGSGAVGYLNEPLSAQSFLAFVKSVFGVSLLRYSGSTDRMIHKVALCGGSGSFLIGKAKSVKADAYVTADLKYHDFEYGQNDFLLIDAGHYETEMFFSEYIIDLIKKKFSNFAIHFSNSGKNVVKYF